MNDSLLMWALPALLVVVVAAVLWWRSRHRNRQRQALRMAAEHRARSNQETARLAAVQAEQQAVATRQAREALERQARQQAEQAALEQRQRDEEAQAQAVQAAARAQAEAHARAETQAHAAREAAAVEAASAARSAADAAAVAAAAAAAQAIAEAAARQAAADAQAAAARDAIASMPVPTPPHASPPTHTPDQPPLILVADDSKVVRVKTSRLLAQHGYRVALAEDGTQAAALIDAELPLVLVTDVEMPGLDGFALTRHVRQHPRAAQIPIIMITSADDRLKAAAAEAGVTLVLGKPYADDALLACIRQAQGAALTTA